MGVRIQMKTFRTNLKQQGFIPEISMVASVLELATLYIMDKEDRITVEPCKITKLHNIEDWMNILLDQRKTNMKLSFAKSKRGSESTISGHTAVRPL